MSLEEITLGTFAACNSLQIFAYVPQICKAASEENGASAISYTTWSLFLLAHLSTVAYAVVNQSDWWLAACFALNAACCLAIVAVAYATRCRCLRRSRSMRPMPPLSRLDRCESTAAERITCRPCLLSLGLIHINKKETLAVSRSCFIPLAVGVWMTTALILAGAAEAASALACAKADLALMSKLADERDPTEVTSLRLAQASMRVLDARAACRAGNYANGIDLYTEAHALTGAASAASLGKRR